MVKRAGNAEAKPTSFFSSLSSTVPTMTPAASFVFSVWTNGNSTQQSVKWRLAQHMLQRTVTSPVLLYYCGKKLNRQIA
jgi:hypothetical protein